TRPTRCAGPWRPRTSRPCSGCRGSAARARSGSCSSWGTASACRRAGTAPAGPRRWRTGATRSSRPSWGWAGTPRRRRTPSARCSAGRCACWAAPVADDRIVAAEAEEAERAAEAALRPRRLAEFVGQHVVREQLELVLHAALARGGVPDHVLLSGPPVLGKTTLAMIIAAELGTSVRVTSGPAIQHAGDLAAVLSSLDEGEVLFVDEIHRLARPAEELLYVAMEDFRVDVVVGKGAGANAIGLTLPPFTVVGATTRAGLLPAPLRDRFGFTGHLDFYDDAELEQVLQRSAGLLEVDLHGDAGVEIARRS